MKPIATQYSNLYTYFNYGMLPQTWSDSTTKECKAGLIVYKKIQLQGDDDPLDICELGSKEFEIGDVIRTQILGAFCVQDKNECDWKVLGLNEEEALAKSVRADLNSGQISTLLDFQKQHPGKIDTIINWFRSVKGEEGKTADPILFNSAVFSIAETLKMITTAHQSYLSLRNGLKKSPSGIWMPDVPIVEQQDVIPNSPVH
eukprot:TRINITY_DN2268_c0_g1_i4.p1 TRINITY_DN2268_c0_g1~~TRINITY_DN2268_c0_g1_i4.p1  ORF type:complete len:202 (-),score=11.64 TRINITY_DN2268_c0_g1_i4:44-649(-)